MQLGQQLWTRPVYPHELDEEFDSNELGSEWYCYSSDTSDYGELIEGAVDVYDQGYVNVTGDTIRYTLNPIHRRSWLFLQPENQANVTMGRLYTPPDNVVVIARMKFNLRDTVTVNPDRSCAMWLSADSGGEPDWSNRIAVYLNYAANGNTYSLFAEVEGGTPTTTNTTDTQLEGQALEYVAIHKKGTTYHGYVGTASGNWIWMGSLSFAPTTAHLELYVRTESLDKPGVGVFGIDFIRFYETDNFLF